MIRLDKYLADMGVGTRSEVKNYIRKRKISVNSEVVADPNRKIILGEDEVLFEGNHIGYVSIEYYMLNKPAGVLSATEDKRSTTVIDLITTSKRKDLFPVGRLDKDTEGLLIITNDGELAHNLLSPRKHVDKVYFARIDGMVTNEDVVKFEQGLVIDEELTAKPAKLVILSSGEESEIELTIQEGKFHQVKRMFEAVGKKVTYLKRLSMGTLQLDPTLEPGQYRELSEGEITALRS
ncbi:MAG TPA: pseudouridine synthase [Lachnospiraceae bacterium]|nr:pseudouridine synthase [Lachnospiraceae bacterium]